VIITTFLKQHPPQCHVFKDVDDLTMIDLDVFFYSKQEKVREPFFSTQAS
jgi:hypothetical protein